MSVVKDVDLKAMPTSIFLNDDDDDDDDDDNLVCLRTAWDLPASLAANRQHSQIKTEPWAPAGFFAGGVKSVAWTKARRRRNIFKKLYVAVHEF